MRRRSTIGTILVLVATAAACGGGGGSPDGGVISGVSGESMALAAGFVAVQSPPGPASVGLAAAPDPGASDRITVDVQIGELADLFGGSFDLVFDPAHVAFESWAPGTVLEVGGQTPSYQVFEAGAGRLVVGFSRTGADNGVAVTGTGTLMSLSFRVLDVGSSLVDFEGAALIDSGNPPATVPSVRWYGGEITGN